MSIEHKSEFSINLTQITYIYWQNVIKSIEELRKIKYVTVIDTKNDNKNQNKKTVKLTWIIIFKKTWTEKKAISSLETNE